MRSYIEYTKLNSVVLSLAGLLWVALTRSFASQTSQIGLSVVYAAVLIQVVLGLFPVVWIARRSVPDSGLLLPVAFVVVGWFVIHALLIAGTLTIVSRL
jgi:hypothetical protein